MICRDRAKLLLVVVSLVVRCGGDTVAALIEQTRARPNDLNLKFTQMHVQGVENQFRVLGCITPACMGCFFPVQLSAQSLLGFGKGDTFSIPNPIEWAPESFPLPKL